MSESVANALPDCGAMASLLGSTPTVGEVNNAIVRVARLHRILAGQLLREVGLHPSQELVMMQLWDCGPQRQSDLARTLGTDAATMTRTVQRLEQGGFVRRAPSVIDRRVSIVEATTASRALRAGVQSAWQQLEESAAGNLTNTERAAVLELLGRMETSLDHVIHGLRPDTDTSH